MSTPQRPILTFDCGTTSVRAILFGDGDEGVIAVAQQEFAQHFPEPGRVEHDAAEIWRASLACARGVLASAAVDAPGVVDARGVAAIAITNQRETAVVWDRATGEPIAPAIVWQDRRTAPLMATMRAAGHEERVRALTGLRLDPYFSASKFAWILDHVPGARARAERGELAAGTIDAWMLWNLTGGRVHATDASNASRTLLAAIGGHAGDAAGCAWSDELCALFRVPRAMLPAIVDSAGVVGASAPGLLGAAIPIAGIAGDQQAALFGQRCVARGMAKCTFGTGCFLLAHAGDEAVAPPEGLLTTVAWRIAGRTEYAVEGSVFVGGSAVQWLRDGLRFFARASEVNALAASVPDSGGVVVVPAFAGLGAPWWDAEARGAVLGLTRGATKAHVARATLEGVAHQVADLVDAIRAGGIAITALRVDGGAAASDLLMQMQADLAGLPVERPHMLESTAFGAALLARVGLSLAGRADAEPPDAGPVDAGASIAEVARESPLERTFTPTTSATAAADRAAARGRWRAAVTAVRTFAHPEPNA
jgi:glycerol kinase